VPPANVGWRRRAAAVLAAVALAGGALVGCTTEPDTAATTATSTATTGAGSPATGTAPAGWTPCRGGLECTTLEVPADWADPDGPTISIAAARRPATSGTARGVVLANPGGPGASGIDWLAGAGDLAGIGEQFDLVSWDPRGVGASTQLDCNGVGGAGGTDLHRSPTSGPEAEVTTAVVESFVAACAAGSPELVDHLGTDQGVADMDAVRAAAGAERVDVVGFSYGTYLGLAYTRTYPQRVRTLVLDAVVNPADSLEALLVAQATAMEAQLDDVLAAQPGLWDRAAARTDPATLGFAAIAATYDPNSLARLVPALTRAADGDASGLTALAGRYFSSANYTAYLATLCADLDRPTDVAAHDAMAQRLEALAPRVGPAIAGEVAPCARWPVANGTRWQPVAPDGVRIIVVGATGDAATPLPLAESVAGALAGSTLVIRQGGGHVSLTRSPCVADVVRQAIVTATTVDDPITCPS